MILKMSEMETVEKHRWLISSVAPRPIGLASTISREGEINLSPSSFFNVFSIEPPVLIFSPARLGVDAALKGTLFNLRQVAEVAISIVDVSILRQTIFSG